MKINIAAIMILFLIFAEACVPVKKLSYFNDINDLEAPSVNPRIQKTIMPFDKIFVRVISIDPQTNLIFNTSEGMGSSSNTVSGIIGYLVDEKGNINFPFVGDINVEGLTTSQAAVKIEKALSDYVSNTSVIVKFVDNQVTLIGEVQNQGVFDFTQDKLNIYQALGLGGGVSRYGDRKNIILLRHEGEKIVHYKLNVSDSKIATKDYYYILPNDIIVVEPLRTISSSYSNITYSTVLSSITTLIAILLFTGVSF